MLYKIQEAVRQRSEEIIAANPGWPCRKGCDDCCRNLAAEPRVSADEWRLIARALDAHPPEVAEAVRRRIRDAARQVRPVVCPLLDRQTGACLVYDARPVFCRTYGFYAERDKVLGCAQIEQQTKASPVIVWGNHAVVEGQVCGLGQAMELSAWLNA